MTHFEERFGTSSAFKIVEPDRKNHKRESSPPDTTEPDTSDPGSSEDSSVFQQDWESPAEAGRKSLPRKSKTGKKYIESSPEANDDSSYRADTPKTLETEAKLMPKAPKKAAKTKDALSQASAAHHGGRRCGR